jgi:predicted metal-dependent hydrolase
MNVMDFGSRKITYNLHREERKQLRIVVSPELTVDVFAPATADKEQIRAVVMKKAAWIAGKLDALEKYHPLPIPKKYISGEIPVYLGRQYRLKVEQGLR